MSADVQEAGGVLGALRKEIERGAVRARNGIKVAGGATFAPPNPTPSDVIWREGKVHVRRYRRETPARLQPPVVAFLGLVGNSSVFDLYKGGSIAQMLLDWGFDAYVWEWGGADETDAENSLDLYLGHYFPRGLRAICEESGTDDVNVLAYCMGGILTMHALAAQPELPIRSVVTLASPFDFRHTGAVVDALREGKITPEDAIDETGNVPGPLVRESFKRLKPTSDFVNYANLWQNLWNDRYVEGWQAIGRFLHDHPNVAGAAFRQIVEQWMRGNAFVTNRLRLNGRHADLGNVRVPVLAAIAKRDDIAYESSTSAIKDVLPNADVELLKIDSGHVSLFAGREAVKVVMPQIFQWLEAHSEEIR